MAGSTPVRALFVAASLCILIWVSNSCVNAFSARTLFRNNKRASTRIVEEPKVQTSPSFVSVPRPTTTKRSNQQQKRRFWSRLWASNTFDPGSKKVLVKQRARVLLDPQTGKLTEIQPAPSINNASNRGNPWTFIKRAFYSTTDAVKSVQRNISNKDKGPPRPVDGYSTTIEKTILKSSSSSPGERLMKEYQERALGEETDTRTTGMFDAFKNGFYNTVDGISNLVKPKQEEKPLKSPLQSYKTVVQPTLATSPQVKQALPNLKSPSPAKRILAELQIKNWEEEQKRRKRDYERKQAAESFKEAAYAFGDGVVLFVQSLGDLPTKLNQAAVATQEWIASIPTVVENTVETVTSIPQKVGETVEQVQTTVETSVQTTKRAVENVQALPSKIQQTVKNTQRGVDETITNVKVLVGVEEKKPVPPEMPPPKPRSAEELAWDIASGIATVVGKSAWFVTVGAAKLSFAGAKLAFEKLSERSFETGVETVMSSTTVVDTPKGVEVEEDVKVTETANGSKSKSTRGSFFGGKQAPKPTPADTRDVEKAEQEALDKEVSDALALAEKAMALADATMESKKKGKSELDVALRKAREAAATANKEAVELEETSSKS